jgi:hypothetical protein
LGRFDIVIYPQTYWQKKLPLEKEGSPFIMRAKASPEILLKVFQEKDIS